MLLPIPNITNIITTYLTPSQLYSFFSNCPTAHFKFNALPYISFPLEINRLLKFFPNIILTKLNINCLWDSHITITIPTHKITHLQLNALTNTNCFLKTLPNLTFLSLECIREQHLNSLTNHQQLQFVKIKSSHELFDISFLPSCPNLHTFSALHLKFTQSMFSSISNCKNLIALDLWNFSTNFPLNTPILITCKKLKTAVILPAPTSHIILKCNSLKCIVSFHCTLQVIGTPRIIKVYGSTPDITKCTNNVKLIHIKKPLNFDRVIYNPFSS